MSGGHARFFKNGQLIGVLPVEHAYLYCEVFKANFPGYDVVFYLRDSEVHMLVEPHLTKEDGERWDELYEAKQRELQQGG